MAASDMVPPDLLRCRNDPSGRGISRVERMTLKATAANAARVHDRGGHTNPVNALRPSAATGSIMPAGTLAAG